MEPYDCEQTITKEQWAKKSLHVGLFDGSASSGEIASHEGLPLLQQALNRLSALDPNHRQGVVDIVLAWQSHSHGQQFWEILQAMDASFKQGRAERDQRFGVSVEQEE